MWICGSNSFMCTSGAGHEEVEIGWDGTAGGAPLLSVIGGHPRQVPIEPTVQAGDPSDGHTGEDGFQHHLVERRLWKVLRRVPVLAGDRLEYRLHARSTRLDRGGEKTPRLGEEGQRAKHRLALAVVPARKALADQLDRGRVGKRFGGTEEEG